jgi:hypothetical protein
MPDQAGGGGNADEEHDRSGCEQESQEPHEKAHYRCSVLTLSATFRGVSFNS